MLCEYSELFMKAFIRRGKKVHFQANSVPGMSHQKKRGGGRGRPTKRRNVNREDDEKKTGMTPAGKVKKKGQSPMETDSNVETEQVLQTMKEVRSQVK